MAVTATDEVFGRDASNHPAQGGFLATGEARTLEMVDGSVPGLGMPLVEVNNLSAPSAITQGTLVTSNVAAALAASAACKYVSVTNPSSNTDTVYVGGAGVTTANGYELLPGESVGIEIDDIAKVFVIAGSNTPTVRYMALA
jgi:hypothetical protein